MTVGAGVAAAASSGKWRLGNLFGIFNFIGNAWMSRYELDCRYFGSERIYCLLMRNNKFV
jgi:hypothetical protein